VLFLFWAARPRPAQGQQVALAFVQYYTEEGTGRLDNTCLKKLCWELEPRPAADRFPGMHPRYDVVPISALIKLEHIVPVWYETAKEMFYVNKYASFA
jgi:hypothetical protein